MTSPFARNREAARAPLQILGFGSAHCPGVLRILVAALLISVAAGLGGEKAAFDTSPSSANYKNHRQDVCDRYEKYRAGEMELRHALSGLSLTPFFYFDPEGTYFKYSHEHGIAKKNPGILAEMLDSIAERANFTWRSSFGIVDGAHAYNISYTELLLWGLETYDIAIAEWDHSVERMERGVTYTEPWYDASLILIDQRKSLRDPNVIDPLNWTKPFEPAVWGMIVLTVFLSALVYQLIEYIHGEREDRSFYQWFSDNLYLSAINFSQNFEYAPNSAGGRIFGVSMTIWALVITATYTANLASLFVEARVEPILVDSMEAAVLYGYPVCTWADTNADDFIHSTFPKANREPRFNEKLSYESLRNGECALAVTSSDRWKSAKLDEDFNPDCDLEAVGDVVKVIKSGFAVKADAGHKCSSLIRDVFNVHFAELIDEGYLAELWRIHRELEDDGHCVQEEEDQRRRKLQANRNKWAKTSSGSQIPSRRRRLKAGGKGSDESDGDEIDADTLTIQQMMGTFLVHWGAMAIAVLVSCITAYTRKVNCCVKEGYVVEKVTNRPNGPIIGMPPPINTYVARRIGEEETSDGNDSSDLQDIHEREIFSDEDQPSTWQMAHTQTVQHRKAVDLQLKALDAKLDILLQMQSSPPQYSYAAC